MTAKSAWRGRGPSVWAMVACASAAAVSPGLAAAAEAWPGVGVELSIAPGHWRVDGTASSRPSSPALRPMAPPTSIEVCVAQPTSPQELLLGQRVEQCHRYGWREEQGGGWKFRTSCEGEAWPGSYRTHLAGDLKGDLASVFELRINVAVEPLDRSGRGDMKWLYRAERLGPCPED